MFSPLFKRIAPYIFLVTLGFLLYYAALSFSFSYLDDNHLIINNHEILKDGGLLNIFTSDVFFSPEGSSFYYRPLLNISFLLDSYLGGIEPFFYHYSNLVLHLIAACLVFSFLKKFLLSKGTAFFLSLIFLVHPALTQAVAWIPGRNDSLLTVLAMSSFILFTRFLETDKIIYWWLHLSFFILALFTKETAVFMPLVFLAYYLIEGHSFSKENISNNMVIALVTWSSSIFIWGLLRNLSLSGESSLRSIISSELNNLPALMIYIGKTILPFDLGVYPTLKDSSYWMGFFSLILIGMAFLKTDRINWRRVGFGFFWFLVFLLPSFIRPNDNTGDFLEHRLYLSIIGLLILVSEIFPIKYIDWKQRGEKIAAFLAVALFCSLTFWHSFHFSDSLSFWKDAVKTSPRSAFVNNNLGSMYYLEGNLKEAQKYYLQALSINPDEKLVHNNLGLIAANYGRSDVAEAEYKKEISLNPYYDNVWVNLGLLYLKDKRKEEAIASFRAALNINPYNVQAYDNLLILSSKVE